MSKTTLFDTSYQRRKLELLEPLLAQLRPIYTPEEIEALRMAHGKTRYKAAVKRWRKRDQSSGELKLGRIRLRKEKLERLLDEIEGEQVVLSIFFLLINQKEGEFNFK